MSNAHLSPGLTHRNIQHFAANEIAAAELALEGRTARAAADPGSAKFAANVERATVTLAAINQEQKGKCSAADVAAARAQILRNRANADADC